MSSAEWMVEIDGEEFTTDIATLKAWIAKERVAAHHRVRRGSLPWTEARLVPPLRDLFSGDRSGGEETKPTRPSRAYVLVATGSLHEPHEIIDAVFAYASDSNLDKEFLSSEHWDTAFDKVKQALREKCQAL